MKRLGWIVFAGAVASLPASVASASCVGPEPMSQERRIAASTTVFEGTVVALRNNDPRWVIVRVDKELKGNLDPEVEVWGWPGPEPPAANGASSIDRLYRPGGRYRFFFKDQKASPFKDSACSPTEHLGGGEEVGLPIQRAPRQLAAPIPRAQPEPFPWAAVGGGVAAIVGGLVALAFVSRRSTTVDERQS